MLLKRSYFSITAFILLLIPISVNAQEEQTIPQPQIPLNNSTLNPSINYPLGDLTQQGIINNNSSLGQTNNCGRSCINFYTDFSRNDSRFGVNLSIPLSEPSNELTTAQSKRTLYEVESGYIKAISEACLAKDIIRAELSAKGLARVWNVDYKTLLRPSCG
jgi:hypothetical protein